LKKAGECIHGDCCRQEEADAYRPNSFDMRMCGGEDEMHEEADEDEANISVQYNICIIITWREEKGCEKSYIRLTTLGLVKTPTSRMVI